MLPLISRQWARMLGGPSAAWEKVDIDTYNDFPYDVKPDVSAVIGWFHRRVGSIQNLQILSEGSDYRPTTETPALPASLLSALLDSQAPSLRVMQLDMVAVMLSTAGLSRLTSVANNLEDLVLKIRSYEGCCWDDHGSEVIQTLSKLPALTELTLEGTAGTLTELPTVSELANFCSTSLTGMTWHMYSAEDSTLTVGSLPALVNCSLCWEPDYISSSHHYGPHHALNVTPASFSVAARLTRLHIEGPRPLVLAPCCFDGLSQLVKLYLCDCRLLVVPAALAGVGKTLQLLDLYDNAKLQIHQSGYDTLMSLSVLKHINMENYTEHCGDHSTEMSHWSICSVQFLSRFVFEWCKLRPGVTAPTLMV